MRLSNWLGKFYFGVGKINSRRPVRARKRTSETSSKIERLEERVVLATWTGDIPNGTVWATGQVQQIIGNVHIPAGSTLTIQPGAVVKFNDFANFSLTVDGTLNAQGTAGQPIYFTTLRDDSVGGDTQGNGQASVYGGQWDALIFNSSSTGNVLDHVEVRYGGEGGIGSVIVNGGPLTLTNSTVLASGSSGVRIQNSNPTLTNILFKDNTVAASMDLNSNPAISGVTLTNNATNALRVDGGTMTNGGTWNDPNITYLVQDAITVPTGKTLTIAAGQVVKFREFGNFGITVNGTLAANGTVGAPIYFTTTRDDSVGGDTYNNGLSDSYGGQWDALTFNSTSLANVLDHVEVRYGGESGVGSVVANSAPLTLTNSKLISSSVSGIRILNSNPTLTNIVFKDNAVAASMDLNSNPAISGVTMTNNGRNALLVDGGTMTNGGTWNDPNITYLITGGITVPVGKTLTISAGQVVKFSEFGNFGITVNGTLAANGTVGAPIYFTTSRDDAVGGDATNNGLSDSYLGQWDALKFNSTSLANVLDHVEVRYGGEAGGGSVIANGGPLTLTNSKVMNSAQAGVRILNSNPTLTNVTFQANEIAASMDLNSNPAITGVTMIGNGVNALRVDGGVMTNGGLWNDPDITYVVQDGITVPVGKTLTIAAGQVVKFREFGNFGITVNGTLAANGTQAAPIYFTTTRDDTIGGDTYNNGQSDVYAGQWDSLTFNNTSVANILDHVELRHGGESGVGMVVLNSAPLTLTNSKVIDSSVSGIRIQGSNPVMTNLVFQGNAIAARMDLNSNPAISGVTMTSNAVNALLVDGGIMTNGGVWDDPDITYLVQDAVTVPVGKTLAIAAGQVVKFREFAGTGITVNGTLTANGAFAAPIYFVSTRDDSVGGDTYNNTQNSLYAGQWNSLTFTSSSDGNLLDYVRIRQGGANSPATVVVSSSELTLSNSKLELSASNGIIVQGNSDVDLVNNVIFNNGDTGVRAESGATVTVSNNTLDGNYRGAAADGNGTSLVLTNDLITNNSNAGVVASNRGLVTASYNDVFNPGSSLGNYSGLASATGTLGNVSVDPKYVNRATLDFHLQAASPVIDAGTSNNTPIDDLDFTFRVDNLAVANTGAGTSPFYDMGAYEFGGRLRAVKHTPSGKVADAVSQIVLTFRAAMDTSSFSLAADVVSFTGPTGLLVVTGFKWISKYQLALTFNEQSEAGDYQLVVSPNILDAGGHALDTDGDGTLGENPGDRYTANWTIVPPRIVSQSAEDYTPAPINHLNFTFDRAMDQDSFDLSDVISFTGPNGAIPVTGFSWLDPRTLSLTFASQSVLGPYEMILGPNIADLGGNLLDQSGNGVAGEVTADRYTADFTLANILIVSGNISQNTTWGGLVIVDGAVTVQAGVTLTINPGTIIKFDDTLGLTIATGATLLANGTAAQPIRFTSIHDDTIGGDSDHNGDRVGPNIGDWNGIVLLGGNATIDHGIFSNGGGTANGVWDGTTGGNLSVQSGSTLTLTNSAILNSFFDGILAQGGSQTTIINSVIADTDRAINVSGPVTLTNSTLDDNRIGIWGHSGKLVMTNSIISHSLQQGVYNILSTDTTIKNSDVWSATGQNYLQIANQTGTNGNISADPKYVNAENANYRLNFGSPAIDAANGAAAPVTDQGGAPRYDDPRTANTGTITSNNAFADMGAFEFVEGAASNLDLVVSSVSGPGAAMEGDTITVNWSEKNLGTAVATGTWHDAIYLSADPVWSADDVLLDEVLHDGNLGPNQSYSTSADVKIPGLLPGSYYLLVRANSDNAVFEGSNQTNNVTASTGTIALDVPTLSVGTPVTGHLDASGDTYVYKLIAAPGSDVKVSLDGPNGAVNELYLKQGDIPTRQSFDSRGNHANQPDQSAALGNSQGGTYYVVVYGAVVPNGEAFTLSAALASFAVDSVSPVAGSNAGQVTITISGTDFDSASHPRLIDSNNQTIEPTQVFFSNPGQILATFDLRGHAMGAADVQVVSSSNVVKTLTDGFVIDAGNPGELDYSLTVPDRVRLGRNFSIIVEYRNTGETDLLAPLMVLSTDGSDQLSLSSDLTDLATSIQILAVNPDGLAGVLPPGATGRIEVFAKSIGGGTDTIELGLGGFGNGAIPWNTYEAMLRPADITDQEWGPLFVQFKQDIGSQYSDYLAALSRGATALPPEFGLNYSVADVLGLLVDQSYAKIKTSVSGRLFLNDLGHPAANVDLDLFDPTNELGTDTTSLADGTFLFSNVAPGTYQVSVDGVVLATPLTFTVAGVDVNLGDLLVNEGGLIAGTAVLGATGQPLPDVIVTAQSGDGQFFTVMTDEEGRYEFDGLPAGDYEITAGGGDYSTASLAAVTANPDSPARNKNLVLALAGQISGTVLGPTGQPVAGVTVAASLGGGAGGAAVTGNDGTYLITGLDAGTYTLVARTSGFTRQTLNNIVVHSDSTTDHVNISLAIGGTLQGTVTGLGTGIPAPFALVTLLNGTTVVTAGQADASGHFVIADIAPGSYTVKTNATGLLENTDSVTITAGQTANKSPILAPAGVLHGTVVDGAGHPLSNIQVTIVGDNQGGGGLVVTDVAGHYSIDELPYDDYTLSIGASVDNGVAILNRTLNAAGHDATADFTFAGANQIAGHVFAADGSTPLAHVPVVVYQGGIEFGRTYSDAQGNYALILLESGTYDLAASGDTVAFPVRSNLNVTSNSSLTGINFTAGSFNAHGILRDQTSGDPLGGATVVVINPLLGPDLGALPKVVTGADGTFQVNGLAAGTYDILIHQDTHALVAQSFTIAANGTVSPSLDFNMGPASKLIGQITALSSGQPVGLGLVYVYRPSDGRLLGVAPTDAQGNYTFNGLAPGNYDVVFDPPGLEQKQLTNVAVGSSPTTVNVQLNPSTNSISGTFMANGHPVINSQVNAVDSTGRFHQTVATDGSGHFIIDTMPPGTTTIQGSAPGMLTAPTQVTTVPGQSATAPVLSPTHTAINTTSQPSSPTNEPPPPGSGGFLNTINSPTVVPIYDTIIPQAKPGCEPLRDIAIQLYQVAVSTADGVRLAQDAQDPTFGFINADVGIVVVTRLKVIADVLSLANAFKSGVEAILGQAKNAALIAVGQNLPRSTSEILEDVLAEIKASKLDAVINAVTTVLDNGPNIIKAIAAGKEPEASDLYAVRGSINDMLGVVGEIARTAGKLAPLAAASPLISGLLGPMFAIITLGFDIQTAIEEANKSEQGIIDRDQALGNAEHTSQLAALKLKKAILLLKACNAQVTAHPKDPLPTVYVVGKKPKPVNKVAGKDPNDKTGPAGYGPQKAITPGLMPYEIEFENDPREATAAVQEVVVTDTLDADVDVNSLQFTGFGFGSHSFTIPSGLSNYETTIDLRPDGIDLLVTVNLAFNSQTRVITATFGSFDPVTGLPPDDPDAGFLPINNASHDGEGFITYTVQPMAGLSSGTTIDNQASIVFDINAPIVTPTTHHTLDVGGPTSAVTALPSLSSSSFLVNWLGTDDVGGSGIASYDIYVSDNNGDYTLWQAATAATSATYAGVGGHTYRFYSVAQDNVGHIESAPITADTITATEINTAPSILTGQSFNVLGNATVNTVVGSVSATDADQTVPNKTKSFSITSGNATGAFAINSATGQITVANAAALTALAGQTATLQITVTDGGTPALSDVENVGVTVAAVNTPPVLANPGPAPTFIFKLKTPAKVTPTLAVTDADGAASLATIVISLQVGDPKKNPDIVSLPGLSTVGTRLDAIVSGRLQITITLKEGATNAAVQTMLEGMTFATKGKGLKVLGRDFQIRVTDRTGLQSNLISQHVTVKKK